MPTTMIQDMDDLVRAAINEVFDTMLNLKIEAEPPGTELLNGEAHIASSVGFIGKLTGIVYIYSSASFARTVTATLVGLEEAEIDGEEMVNDAMGEVANMIVGNVKSRLSDRGMPCVLTIPSIVRGSHFTIEAVSSTERRVVSFKCLKANQQIVIEILIKSENSNN